MINFNKGKFYLFDQVTKNLEQISDLLHSLCFFFTVSSWSAWKHNTRDICSKSSINICENNSWVSHKIEEEETFIWTVFFKESHKFLSK